MGLVGVDFVRNIHEGIWGGTNEDSEIGWHNQRELDVGERVDARNVDQNNPFLDRITLVVYTLGD